jgi:ribosomal protein L11 methyltransferase
MAQSPYQDLHIYYLEGDIAPLGSPDPAYLGTWREGGDSFVFFSQASGPAMARLLRDHPQATLVDYYEMSYEQWQGAQPASMRLGSFQITPPWMMPAAPGSQGAPRHALILDPGMVFGTGTHATTRDCLGALELVCTLRPPATVLDLGTGTGLLALAAAKLGCRRVLAVDNNYLAAQTTLANIRRNHLECQVLAVQGSAETFVQGHFELLVANIHFAVMERILAAWKRAPGQRFILSGLMRSEARKIHDRLSEQGARILRRWEQDGIWHTFYGEII